tara:strand:+ start:11648 stop:12058 length:411 start_codon:yes stop_codon:yes gene_type:complete
MHNSLEEVFQQALEDTHCTNLSSKGYEAFLVYSIKIIKDAITNEVMILNTAKNGDHYHLLDSEEIKIFLEKGWRYGVYVVSLSNYRLKLNKIERLIKAEANGRGSVKQIKSHKNYREYILLRFSEVNQKLNQLKSK